MSVKYITWAFEVEGLTPTQRVVLLALADWANDDGECYPGQTTLAQKAGVSESTVRRALGAMEDMGLLEREERRRADGYRTSDLYRLDRRVTGSPVKMTAETSPVKSADLTGQIGGSHRSTVNTQEPSVEPPVEEPSVQQPRAGRATEKQIAMLEDLYRASGRWLTDEKRSEWETMSIAEADVEIRALNRERRTYA